MIIAGIIDLVFITKIPSTNPAMEQKVPYRNPFIDQGSTKLNKGCINPKTNELPMIATILLALDLYISDVR